MYLARRLMRMAIEDIGMADPRALEQAVAAQQCVHFLGIPEGDQALAQITIYLRSRQVGCGVSGTKRCPRGGSKRNRLSSPHADPQRSDAVHEGMGLRVGL